MIRQLHIQDAVYRFFDSDVENQVDPIIKIWDQWNYDVRKKWLDGVWIDLCRRYMPTILDCVGLPYQATRINNQSTMDHMQKVLLECSALIRRTSDPKLELKTIEDLVTLLFGWWSPGDGCWKLAQSMSEMRRILGCYCGMKIARLKGESDEFLSCMVSIWLKRYTEIVTGVCGSCLDDRMDRTRSDLV